MNILKQVLSFDVAAILVLLGWIASARGGRIVSARSGRTRNVNLPCEGAPIDVLSESGAKIEPLPSSRVNFHSLKNQFDDGHLLIFEFRTTSENATIFYTTRRNDAYDMVSASISGGLVQFKIRCKSSFADLTVPKYKVDDNKWHKIYFRRHNRKGTFKLDGLGYFRPFHLGCGGFTSVNFGSINEDDLTSYSIQELQQTDGQYTGCIRNVLITTNFDAPPSYTAVSTCN